MSGTPNPTPTPIGTATGTSLVDFCALERVEVAEGEEEVGEEDAGFVVDAELDELPVVVVEEEVVAVELWEVWVIDGLIVVMIVAAAMLNTCDGSEQLHPPNW